MEAQSSQLAFKHPESAAPLQILFDGRKLGDGGIGVYIENTVRGLLESGDVNLTVIASPEQAERTPWRGDVAWVYDSSKQYSLSEYLLMPRRIDFGAYDLYHAPHYTLPFGVAIPSVVTIHDLIHIEHPQAFYYPMIAKRLIRSAVARASRVVTVSNDTRRAVLDLSAADPAKVIHIPNAVPSFLCQNGSEAQAQRGMVSPSMQLSAGDRYFITVVSNCKPHKGVSDLLSAWSEFVERYRALGSDRPCPHLFVVGYGTESIIADKKLSDQVQRTNRVRIIGAVGNDLLRHLYRGAEALVVPSLAEGFCFPALEAQSVGTRVICRPVAALQELVTENDSVARDLSVGALTEAILDVAAKPRESKVIIPAHLERFSLSRVSAELRTVYGAVIAQQQRSCVG